MFFSEEKNQKTFLSCLAGLFWKGGRWIPLVAAGLAALYPCSGNTETLPPIHEIISFGDSLSDAGTYGFRFTTNPGLTFAQHLAVHFGQPPLPNEHVDRYKDVYKGLHGSPGPGGLNYAEGGARVNAPYSKVSGDPEGTPISATRQISHFLQQHQRFRPSDLVTLYVGTNDVAFDYDPANDPALARQLRANIPVAPAVLKAETARVAQAADDEAAIAKDIIGHGAKRLLVFKLMDLDNLPWFRTSAARAFVHQLGAAFNSRLMADLPNDPEHLVVIDTGTFINDLIAHKSSFGFQHAWHEDACRDDDQDYCFTGTLKSRNAENIYIFAAGEHLTTRANQLLAAFVLRTLQKSCLR